MKHSAQEAILTMFPSAGEFTEEDIKILFNDNNKKDNIKFSNKHLSKLVGQGCLKCSNGVYTKTQKGIDVSRSIQQQRIRA